MGLRALSKIVILGVKHAVTQFYHSQAIIPPILPPSTVIGMLRIRSYLLVSINLKYSFKQLTTNRPPLQIEDRHETPKKRMSQHHCPVALILETQR